MIWRNGEIKGKVIAKKVGRLIGSTEGTSRRFFWKEFSLLAIFDRMSPPALEAQASPTNMPWALSNFRPYPAY